MKIPLDFYELLRNRINLSDIVRQKVILTKKSGNYVGLCPFHQEKTPSFTVSDAKKFYYCFGCSSHGDVIKFNAEICGMSYKESAIKLAHDYGIELPKLSKEQQKIYEESDEIFSILELACDFFKSQLSTQTIQYLNSRNVTQDTIKEFDIGFAPPSKLLLAFFEKKQIPLMKLEKAGLVGKREDGKIYEMFYNRIIFPIRNIYNKIIGFGGRVLDNGLPKYLNSPETIVFQKNEALYSEHKAIPSTYKKNYSILVEGYLDVIALHQAGFDSAVASLGTAVSENHLQKLWRAGNEIILCLDGDIAGIKATIRVINLSLPLINVDKKISFIKLPKNTDPSDIISKNGAEAFNYLMNNRISLSQMIWEIEFTGKTFSRAEDKAVLESNLENYCKQISDKLLRNNYHRFFKEQIWQNLVKRSSKPATQSANIIPIYHDYSETDVLEHIFCVILVKLPDMLKKDHIKDFILTLNFQNQHLGDFRNWYFDNIINNSERIQCHAENQQSISNKAPSIKEDPSASLQDDRGRESNNINIFDIDSIRVKLEKTRFYNTFLVLLEFNSLFIDTSFQTSTPKDDFLWELLSKKYHLALLKQEYSTIIKNGLDDDLKKAILYQHEILKVSKDLQILHESFFNL